MIINSEGGVKQTIGQTTEYKTTIDVENLDFIATLLSSNLYSNPEDSFIREIVSNGWDSHVEAGNTNTPLLVRIKKNANYNYDITIRDYGTGLSKEQFENIYCKIGTSTKRDSNNFLGCFGIGKFATMAVSKVSYITSYYNGVSRLYIMTKDGNSITTNLVSEQPTTEHNGLEITVKDIRNAEYYREPIKRLAFFPNVYVDGVFDTCNNIKVKRFKNFSFATNCFDHKILLGNVLYPLDSNIIPSELKPFYSGLINSGIVFNFNIGELNVTPNRESLIYNSKVNELIVQRIKDTKAEIETILNPVLGGDYTNPIKYYKVNHDIIGFDFIDNKVVPYYSASWIPRFELHYLNLPVTFCGKKVNPRLAGEVGRIRPLNIKAVSDGDKMWKDKFPWQTNRILDNEVTPVVILNSSDKITKYIKEYLIENYENFIICKEFNKTEYVKTFVKTTGRCNNRQMTDEETFVIDKCWEFMKKRFVNIDFNNDKEFLAFKDSLKKEVKTNKVTLNEKIILSIMNPGATWPHKRDFKNYQDVIKYIKSTKTGVLVRNLDTMQISNVASKLGYTTIAANKKVVDLLNKETLKCKISEDTIVNHPRIRKLAALFKSGLHVLLRDFDYSFTRTLPKELYSIILEARQLVDKLYHYSIKEIVDVANIDEEFYNACITVKKCYESYVELISVLDIRDSISITELISYIIMKNKLYKIGYDCYKNMKENKLLKASCEK